MQRIKKLLFAGLALLAIDVARADEPQSGGAEQRLLAEKLVELEKLQGEVDRLRRKTGQLPQQVLVRVRALEIQTGKLPQPGRSQTLPGLQAPPHDEAVGLRQASTQLPASNLGYCVIEHESLEATLQELDAGVKQGFAKILADASVLTVAGRHERMLSGSELKVTLPPSIDGRKVKPRFVGLDLELLSRVNADQLITLDCNFKWSEKDFTHMVKSQDSIVPGIRSRSLCTQIQMRSKETVLLKGLAGRGSNSSLAGGDVSAAQQTEFVCLITCERVQPQ